MTIQEKDEINKLRAKGIKLIEIAEKLNLPYNSVKSFCRREPIREEAIPRCKFCGSILDLSKTKRKKEFCSSRCRLKYWRAKKHDK